jgi:hypothetical protein
LVKVVGSTIELPVAAQSSSVDVITPDQVRQRNEAFAMDLLRYIPAWPSTRARGGVTSLFCAAAIRT